MPSADSPDRPRDPRRRVFFALWPDEASQTEMERAARDTLLSLGNRFASAAVSAAPRIVPAHNLHVTLAFLGSVEESRLPAVRAIAAGVSAEVRTDELGARPQAPTGGARERTRAVKLVFDRIAYWKKAKVLCALTGETPESAAGSLAVALADQLKSRLLSDGFTPDLKPFRAHVTLARKVTLKRGPHPHPAGAATLDVHERTLAMTSVTWRFPQFALIDSRTGASGSLYSVLDRWPLCREGAQISGKNRE